MNEDKVIKMLLSHEERLERIETNMATKKDFERIVQTQDQMMVILKRLDEERVFTFDHVKRLEAELGVQKQKIEEQGQDLNKIKLQLKIAWQTFATRVYWIPYRAS